MVLYARLFSVIAAHILEFRVCVTTPWVFNLFIFMRFSVADSIVINGFGRALYFKRKLFFILGEPYITRNFSARFSHSLDLYLL